MRKRIALSIQLCLQDLPRTFPANAWVNSAEGQAALRRVLLAFSVHKPDVGYCQSMNYLAGMLLLCLDLAEERAFWVIVALIDDNGERSLVFSPLLTEGFCKHLLAFDSMSSAVSIIRLSTCMQQPVDPRQSV